MKKLPSLLVVSTLVCSAFAAPQFTANSLRVDGTLTNFAQNYDINSMPTVSVVCSGAEAVWCNFKQGNSTVRVYMTSSGNTWSARLPKNHNGQTAVTIEASDGTTAEAQVMYSNSSFVFNVTEANDEARHPTFRNWQSTVGRTANKNSKTIGTWATSAVYMPDVNELRLLSKGSTASSHAYIRGKVDSCQILYFKAKFSNPDEIGRISIDNWTRFSYTELATIEVIASEDGSFHQYAIPLNINTSFNLRIRNSTAYDSEKEEDNAISLADVWVSPYNPDVVINKEPLEYKPGYPSVQDPIEFTIDVAQKDEALPAENITPQLWWRQDGGVWHTQFMTNVLGISESGPGTYKCVVTDHNAGSFEYFYRADFTGYAPNIDYSPNTETIVVENQLDYRTWIDSDGKVCESRSPAYSSDFCDMYQAGKKPEYLTYFERDWDESHLFDIANLYGGYPVSINDPEFKIESEFEYHTLQAADGVRRFRSQYDKMLLAPHDFSNVVTSRLDSVYSMTQVGDYTWQAIVHVTNTIDSCFAVTSTCKFVEGNTFYEPITYTWGEVDQPETGINPPMSGTLVCDPITSISSGAQPVRVQISYDGFLMFRFCTTNGSYQIRRAAWQDFNSWQADEFSYARSFGLYDTQTFTSSLDGREKTSFADTPFLDLDEIPGFTLKDDMQRSAYWGGVIAKNAWAVRERPRANPADFKSVTRNMAYRLSTMPDYPGSLETTRITRGRGRDTFSFRVRSSSDDTRAALWAGSKGLTAYNGAILFEASSMSDANAEVILYANYVNDKNYLAFRIKQITDLGNNGNGAQDVNKLELSLVSCVNGIETRLSQSTTNKTLIGSKYFIVITINNGTLTGQIYDGASMSTVTAAGAVVASVTATINVSHTGGYFGFNVKDCEATCKPYMYNIGETMTLSGSSATALKAIMTSSESEWDLGNDRYYNYTTPWSFSKGGNVTNPTSLKRNIPTAYYRVKIYRSNQEVCEDYVAPVPGEQDWDDNWDVFNNHNYDKILEVKSLTWKKVNIPMNIWDDAFICIEALADNGAGLTSNGTLMIDDLACKDWCGVSVYDPGTGIVEENSFIGSYAVIGQKGDFDISGNRNSLNWELNRTRVNPDEQVAIQSIVTPYLEHGVGDILFNYQVERAPVLVTVDLMSAVGDSYTEIFRDVLGVTGVSASLYVPALSSNAGRLRITTHPYYIDDVEQCGTLYIDNIRTTDYPNTGDSSWEAYNVLVSPFRTEPSIKFDGVAAQYADYRSAVLNDSYTQNTLQGYAFTDSIPYIQTPSINTGVGEVSFWYRASPDNGGHPAKLHLMVQNAATAPYNEWVELTVDDLNADSPTYLEQKAALEALSNITTTEWTYFTAEFYQQEYTLLRVYSEVEALGYNKCGNRVMLDNVLITEPVRSSIDVGSIEFDPDIPLSTGDVGCKIKLVNPRMSPSDIHVRLDYYVGTNKWGYSAWRNTPTGSLTFTNTVDNYTFASATRIPRQAVDSVVQYCAVVTYQGTFPSPIYSEQQGQVQNGFWFVNPSWYEPVDLNKMFNTEEHPVAHFWTFSATTNIVKFNEIKPTYGSSWMDEPARTPDQFIELIGPIGTDVSGWTIELAGRNGDWNPIVGEPSYTFKIQNGARLRKPSNDTADKGWGLYVLGAAKVTEKDQELYLNDPDTEAAVKIVDGSYCYMQPVDAMVLRRSMGAYVQRVCWTSSSYSAPMNKVQDFIDAGYQYLCNKRQTSANSIQMYYGSPEWVYDNGIATAGEYNMDQEQFLDALSSTEPEVPVVLPEISTPDIVDIKVGAGTVDITFEVAVTNGVDLKDGDYTWYVDADSSLTMDSRFFKQIPIEGAVTASADGSKTTMTVTIDLAELAQRDSLFFRVHAYPAQ